MFTRIVILSAWLSICSLVVGADEEQKITFDDHIKPIFREHCTACHSESDKASDLALDTYGAIMAGGSSGKVVEENKPDGSRLWALVNHVEQPYMPPDEDPIADAKRALIKTWIEQGMPENSGSKIKRSSAAATAMLGEVSLGRPEGPPPMPEMLLLEPIVETERAAAISAMAASPWAPLLAISGQEQVLLYHTESRELLGILPFPEGEPQSLTFTRDGKQLLIGGGRHSHSGCAVLVDIASGERIAKVGDELDTVLAADISPDKQRIAIAGPQRIVRIYDTLTGELVVEMKKHTDWVYALRFSPDGVLLASSDRSNGLILWEAQTGRLYGELVGHKSEVRSLDFRADSNVLASASLDGTVKLWDMAEPKEIKSWEAHGGGATAVVYAHDGSLATAGRDAKVKTWNADGSIQKEFVGLSEMALEVALAGDATFVAGGDWQGNVKLWSTADPQLVHPVVVNPPSIARRLEAAQRQLEEANQKLTALVKDAQDTETQLNAANQSLAAAGSEFEQSRAVVASSQERYQQLVGALDARAQRIMELELELLELKNQQTQEEQQKLEVAAQLETARTQLAAAETAVATAKTAQSEVQAKYDDLVAQRKAAESRVAAEQQAVEKARADQAALDARAQELQRLAEESRSSAKTIAAEIESLQSQQKRLQEDAAKRMLDLNAAQEHLKLLQQRLEEAAQAAAKAKEDLATAETNATELQQKLLEAEQAALQAQEQLQLFEAAYRGKF